MGTGRKRAGTSQTTVTTRDAKKESSEGTEANSAAQDGQQSQPCWTFSLKNPVTKAIREVTVGTSVQGQSIGSTILVTSSQQGPLGDAPEGVGRKIIKMQQDEGGNLAGKVVEHQKTTVKVELCLEQ